ncbi:hypothetical protein Tco_1035083 [Tanacetum coccineum]
MSDSEHSTVTYTSVSFPVEDDSDIGSPGINVPPMMPEDPYAYIMAAYEVLPSPDYIPSPEVPPSPDYIPSPEEPQSPPPLDFVPKPMYSEYMPQEDEILPAEEQPLPVTTASPTTDSLGYVPESDPEEEPEEVARCFWNGTNTPELPMQCHGGDNEKMMTPTFPRSGTNVRSDVSGRNRPVEKYVGRLPDTYPWAVSMATSQKNYADAHWSSPLNSWTKRSTLGLNRQADNKEC